MHTPHRMATAFARICAVTLGVLALPLQLSAAPAGPVRLSKEQDHNRTMELLHITTLRRGPDGDPTSPRAANFTESSVDSNLRLPDPLLFRNGKPVTSAAMWWKSRRPEIVAAFDTEIYGRVPGNVPAVALRIVTEAHEQVGD